MMRSSSFPRILTVAAVLALHGCVTPAVKSTPSARPDSLQSLISDRLYFGRNIPGGGVVSDADWEKFLSEIVTPRFPTGLTVVRAQGQWRGANAVIEKEESFILDLLHPDDVTSEQAVREIMTGYKTRFRQEAVLRVRDSVRVQLW